eukprot:TRINITY_DN23323_c0_g1_i1.p1 TRINITY_DN23323_c0_g1~~TRINITY_DN23323_c0_g1_i1.p1  ORF type:complete len:316 (-),score=83.19 TRINITY_DN23323_c0_g1_i1:261-1121(-)
MAADSGRFLADGEWLFSTLSREHTPRMIAKAAWQGFLPMYEKGQGLVLLKLHRSRCILAPGAVHVGKQSRKKASQFRISVNEAFSEVVKGVQQHTFTEEPGDCWLADEFAEMYRLVNSLPESERRGVAFHSVELWHKESGRLAAGELGYTVGNIYSSCTGFSLKHDFPGSGTCQLVALGKLLQRCGFELWDLGMELDYKLELGGTMQPRASWIAQVRRLRDIPTALNSPVDVSSIKELLAAAPRREEVEAKAMQQVMEMGFEEASAKKALEAAYWNVEQAVSSLVG